MAQTLKLTTTLANSTLTTTYTNANVSVTKTGHAEHNETKNVGTSEESITLAGDVSADCGMYYFRNLDATNYVEIGTATGVYPWKLKAGESSTGRIAAATTTIYLKANTAACDVQVVVMQD